MYRITWGKWSVALDWLQWARSMSHPSSLSGKVHKGEAITAMSILAVLCEVAPPVIIETLATLAAPLSVQAFLRGDDAILVSHCLPCLAAMATGGLRSSEPQYFELTPAPLISSDSRKYIGQSGLRAHYF